MMRARWLFFVALMGTLPGCGGSLPTGPTPVQPAAPEGATGSPTPAPAPTIRYETFLAFGDSFTEGVIATGTWELSLVAPDDYPSRLALLLQQRYTSQQVAVTNSGRSAEWAVAAARRLPGVLDQVKPGALLLLDGVNDLNNLQLAGVQPTLDAMATMIRTGRAAGLPVLVATLPPQRVGGRRAYAPDTIEPFNAGLVRVAADNDAVLVDIYPVFAADMSLLGPDGLHPTAAGYDVIAQTFFAVIRRTFEITPPSLAPIRQ